MVAHGEAARLNENTRQTAIKDGVVLKWKDLKKVSNWKALPAFRSSLFRMSGHSFLALLPLLNSR
jgi:hypothetical protein